MPVHCWKKQQLSLTSSSDSLTSLHLHYWPLHDQNVEKGSEHGEGIRAWRRDQNVEKRSERGEGIVEESGEGILTSPPPETSAMFMQLLLLANCKRREQIIIIPLASYQDYVKSVSHRYFLSQIHSISVTCVYVFHVHVLSLVLVVSAWVTLLYCHIVEICLSRGCSQFTAR